MDSALNLLKEEINKTNEQEHDLAKWKLGVTAALGVAAFGITKDSRSNHWLLLLVPFVCAYIDLYAYQYQVRIMALARFIRDHSEQGNLLPEYEWACKGWRKKRVYSLGSAAGIGSSFGASVVGPIFYMLVRSQKSEPDTLLVPFCWALGIWFVGIFLIVVLWLYFRSRVRKVEEGEMAPPAVAPAAPGPGHVP